MKLTLASVAVRARSERFDTLAADYLDRLRPYAEAESLVFRSTAALFDWTERLRGRTHPALILLDERGQQFRSEAFAQWIGQRRDDGLRHTVFCIGPADGWTDADRRRATLLLSLGSMTLPHELARVVLSEQLYRAFTILAGHPYHRSG